MQTEITATQLARGLADVLNRVRYRGESFVIVRNGEPVARLEPAGTIKPTTWEEFVRRVSDLVPVGEGFADDLEEVQRSQPRAEFAEWPN